MDAGVFSDRQTGKRQDKTGQVKAVLAAGRSSAEVWAGVVCVSRGGVVPRSDWPSNPEAGAGDVGLTHFMRLLNGWRLPDCLGQAPGAQVHVVQWEADMVRECGQGSRHLEWGGKPRGSKLTLVLGSKASMTLVLDTCVRLGGRA